MIKSISAVSNHRKEAVSFSFRLSRQQTITLLVIAIITLIVQPLFGGFGLTGVISALVTLPLVFRLVDGEQQNYRKGGEA